VTSAGVGFVVATGTDVALDKVAADDVVLLEMVVGATRRGLGVVGDACLRNGESGGTRTPCRLSRVSFATLSSVWIEAGGPLRRRVDSPGMLS
jgi:hypothetical protein